MDIEKLKEKIEQFNIPDRAINAFWLTLNKYKNESFEEYSKYFINDDIKKIEVYISSISLKLGNWPECNYNHLVTCLPILYNGCNIGEYVIMFSLDGEIDDDMLNIY
jgi:hypothetical protein